MDPSRLERIVNQSDIVEVLKTWAYARDRGDWNALANCFHPEATIHISWISDTASAFVVGSKRMLGEIKPGEHSKHNLGSSRVRVNGNRAVSECHVELLRRVCSRETNFDTHTWGRFLDLFEKREDGLWRIFKRTMVYEKDRLDAVDPSQLPVDFWKSMDLNQFPPACRFLCYRLSISGREPVSNIVTVYSNAEQDLLQEQDTWLEQ